MTVVTWHVLELAAPHAACPWEPAGARFAQSGMTGSGRAGMPSGDGRWWSVLARWDDAAAADEAQAGFDPALGAAWHVRLAATAYRGDAVLAGGLTPFDDLPDTGRVVGPAAIVTFAGLGTDPERVGEFLERFAGIADDLGQADGALASAIMAPAAGPVLTFSTWRSLRDAMAWAYSGPVHSATIARHEEVPLVETAGFLRCAVVGSSGTLLGRDPLAGSLSEVAA